MSMKKENRILLDYSSEKYDKFWGDNVWSITKQYFLRRAYLQPIQNWSEIYKPNSIQWFNKTFCLWTYYKIKTRRKYVFLRKILYKCLVYKEKRSF